MKRQSKGSKLRQCNHNAYKEFVELHECHQRCFTEFGELYKYVTAVLDHQAEISDEEWQQQWLAVITLGKALHTQILQTRNVISRELSRGDRE